MLLVAFSLAAVFSAARHRALTFGELGVAGKEGVSAWDEYGPVFRLMLAASKLPDVCGLRIDAAHLAWTGGITYLHRKAPLYMPGTPAEYGYFNYAIVGPNSGAPVVAREGALELVRLPLAQCNPNPGYTWVLP